MKMIHFPSCYLNTFYFSQHTMSLSTFSIYIFNPTKKNTLKNVFLKI